MKPAGIAAALIAGMLLAACKTTEPGSGPVAAAPAAAPAAAAAVALADPLAPGTLHFILSPSGSGNYYGWQIQILTAERSQGFRPFLSRQMGEGESLRAELWPDRYRVRVLLMGEVERDEWIAVAAGRGTVVHVEIGFLSNSIDVVSGAEADRRIAQAGPPGRDMRVTQTFEPLTVALRPGWTGRYDGPQRDGHPVGQGRLRLFEGETEVAVIETATVENGRFVGAPVFADGRQVGGAMGSDHALPDGTATTWPDGRRFDGRYDGLSPREGRLSYPGGTAWTGRIDDGAPSGPGQLTLADGTVISDAPGIDTARFDGAYECRSPSGEATTCFYFEGERIATAPGYMAKVNERNQALAAAAPPSEPVSPPAPPTPAAASAPTAEPAIEGCTHVAGEFTSDGGSSRLALDGAGNGHMWQQTYGGAEVYTFDIDFRYSGTRNGMRFDYGPGIYKDASGQVVDRKTIPGGDADCAYDGRTLVINGKPFTR